MRKSSKCKIVDVDLQGGLGNQLFGWACGYSLSRRLESKLSLNTSHLTQHGFQLEGISHGADIVRTQKRSLKDFTVLGKKPVFKETNFSFDKKFEQVQHPVELKGYFQSWKYFQPDADQIREIIQAYKLESEKAKYFSLLFDDYKFNVVHIRRGDYMHFQNYHGLTSPNYYRRAAELIDRFENNNKFIVFSDEKDLAMEIWPGAAHYISPIDIPHPFDNLILMSKFENFIGSNSSFSWWAAFINRGKGLKIFPRPWFTNTVHDTRDLLIPNWITIGND